MDTPGGSNAESPENTSKSSQRRFTGEWDNARTLVGSSDMTVDDVIAMHLVDCDQCRKAAESRPVALGQKSAHCDTYWHIQLMRAYYEGAANNIVARTEYGDEAPKSRSLE